MELLSNSLELFVSVFGRYLPILSIPVGISFIIRILRYVVLDPYPEDTEEPCIPALTPEDVEVVEKKLSKIPDEPVTVLTYRDFEKPEPKKHVKMVPCKHCLAPKPKGGTCAYCGLG